RNEAGVLSRARIAARARRAESSRKAGSSGPSGIGLRPLKYANNRLVAGNWTDHRYKGQEQLALRRLAEYLKVANDCVLECSRSKDRRWDFTTARLTAERVTDQRNERRITTCTGWSSSCSRSAIRLP